MSLIDNSQDLNFRFHITLARDKKIEFKFSSCLLPKLGRSWQKLGPILNNVLCISNGGLKKFQNKSYYKDLIKKVKKNIQTNVIQTD